MKFTLAGGINLRRKLKVSLSDVNAPPVFKRGVSRWEG
jgi:hypothetical protein